ncbi:TonB-dependent receptor [Flavobacteriaceae bacterium F08102]|nr:TonB-dependent receptor [Flavobacteriaceae bacterium F08102]
MKQKPMNQLIPMEISMIKMRNNLVLFSLLLVSGWMMGQDKSKDTIGTEVINVVKSYTPTVSDAFKIKTAPVVDARSISSKKRIEYSIFSAPVASTFTPDKGKAKILRINPSPTVYENYVSAGFGNFSTPVGELFLHSNSTRYNDFGMFFNYQSSVGGVKDVVLNDDYMDTRLDLYYKQENRDFEWQLNAGGHLQNYNWYGLSDQINYTQPVVASIDEKQKYSAFYAGGKIDYFDSFFTGGNVKTFRFSDRYKSAEIYFLAKPKFEIPIASEYITTDTRLEFLKGRFEQNYERSDKINYTFFTVGFSPSLEILRDNLTINLGVDLLYSTGSGDTNDNKGYYYPNVTASYKLIDQVLTVYTGVTGGLHHNSYRGFAEENPYVSPSLEMKRTDEQYNAFLGLKGKLASNISYNFIGSYKNEKDKPLYKLNPSLTDGSEIVDLGYRMGNSFEVVYDTIKTIGIFGEVRIDFSKELKFGGNVSVQTYETSSQEEAWNLPNLKITGFANYTNDNWFAGADIFYVGNRKDEFIMDSQNAPFTRSQITVGDYIDLNLHGGYQLTTKLSVFAKVNNILSTSYEKYSNFRVQGLQALGGLTYKFDF